jgi:ring-1,2-phenylacetyl-CoA epoxidase subunit PaaD
VVSITDSRAWEVLETVADPEIPVLSIVDLGIVREVTTSDDRSAVTVVLTPTYSGCPATEVITHDVAAALGTVYADVEIRTQLAPAWTTDWLSDAGRQKLAEFGIAPPNGRALLPLAPGGAGAGTDTDATDRPASCPHCSSADLEELAGFGSTPCKALWRCRSCLEPFDYFKVH